MNTCCNQEKIARILVILGWGLPLPVVLPYVVYRIYHENENCWMDTGWANFILFQIKS